MRIRRPIVGTALAAMLAVAMTGCEPDGPTVAAPTPPVPSSSAAVATTTGEQPTVLAGPPTVVPPSTAPPPREPQPAPPAPPAPPPASAASPWTVGVRPLPLRPDGFGQVLPTPEVLRDRRLPTEDRLPAPPTAAFASTVGQVPADVLRRSTWRAGCPVRVDELRYLTLSFWGFDGRHHTGEMIVNARVADDVVSAFGRLHTARFPLEEMRVVNAPELGAPPTGDGNNTTAFVCRPARGQTRWSAHAYGLAVDVNPFCNPYVRGDLVLPELASAYLDRGWLRPGMIRPGDAVIRAFTAIGWTWGGTWSSPRDQMHFSATGG